MNLAKLSLKRPILIVCIIGLIIVTGLIGIKRLGVDLMPPTEFPIVSVVTVYPGTTPDEIEKLISKPLEEQISSISGLTNLSSRNLEGISIIIAQFTFDSDIKYVAEKVKEKVTAARNNLPEDLLDDPTVTQFDMQATPIVLFALVGDMSAMDMYDMAKEKIKPLFEQVNGVGQVQIIGGTRREIQVELDRDKLNAYEIPAVTVANQIGNAGANIPVGKYDRGKNSLLFRTIGEFNNIEQIKKTVVSFTGDVSNSITLNSLATVRDTSEDPSTITKFFYPEDMDKIDKDGKLVKRDYKNSKKSMQTCLMLNIFKQSGANSVQISDEVKKRLVEVNQILKNSPGNPKLLMIRDTSRYIRENIDDVKETMILGIIFAIIVVYLFLGNIRSTIITTIALPNSLLGAFMLMYLMGFTINIVTLLALSLSIGLLIDDAIVVRENIFRKLESGLHPLRAAEHGTKEVALAVVATTLTIIAVFLPIAFLQSLVGQFFKQFGLTVVFAMCVSLFDAMTVAPMLSGYFAGKGGKSKNIVIKKFDQFQDFLDKLYNRMMNFSLNHKIMIMFFALFIFIVSIFVLIGAVKKSFMPEETNAEFSVNIEMPSGTSLSGTEDTLLKIAEKFKQIPELDYMYIQAGTAESEDNIGSLGVFMVPMDQRKRSANDLKEEMRKILAEFPSAISSVGEFGREGGDKEFSFYIKGDDMDLMIDYSNKLVEKLKNVKDLVEVTAGSQTGNPEFQIRLDEQKMQMLGVNPKMAGLELRYHVNGNVVGKLRDKGLEYDIRMRLKPEQRNIKQAFEKTRIPNMQFKMIPLNAIASGENATGPAKIFRENRSRIITISGNLAPGGATGTAIAETERIIANELPLPKGITYSFGIDATMFLDMIKDLAFAMLMALIFMYLILASLYESFITPVTILLAIPPAISGAIYALFLTGKNLEMMSMIGMIMLVGLVTKNSILLVDFALEGVRSGMSRKEAIINAGRIRLRPILMTTFAMLAGMAPVAFGIGASASFKQAMGIAIMGGLFISTLITLFLVPAIFEYVDRFREFVESKFRPKGDEKILAEYRTDMEMSDDLKAMIGDSKAAGHGSKKK